MSVIHITECVIAPIVEYFLCQMTEAMDEKAFDMAYNKAKARIKERENEHG